MSGFGKSKGLALYEAGTPQPPGYFWKHYEEWEWVSLCPLLTVALPPENEVLSMEALHRGGSFEDTTLYHV